MTLSQKNPKKGKKIQGEKQNDAVKKIHDLWFEWNLKKTIEVWAIVTKELVALFKT